MSNNIRKETNCLNCGNEVEGIYCSVCGQKNTVHPEPFPKLMLHYFEDITHYEGNLLKSSWYLLSKPGFLTNVYNTGQRVRFINPIKMYVFLSLITFTYLFISMDLSDLENKTSLGNGKVKITGLGDSIKMIKDSIKLKIDSLQMQEDSLKIGLTKNLNVKGLARSSNDTLNKNGKRDIVLPDDGPLSYSADDLKPDKNDGYFTRKLKNTFKRMDEGFDKNPNGFLKSIFENYLHNLPKSLFVCMPIFALLLALFYFPKKKYFTEQVIFTLHYHSFIIICVLFLLLISEVIVSPVVIAVIFLYIIFYLYKSLRNVFKESRLLTIIKCFCIFSIYYLVVLCVQLIFFLYSAASAA